MATLTSLIAGDNFRYLGDVSNSLDNNGYLKLSANGLTVNTVLTIPYSALSGVPAAIDGTFESLSDVSTTIYNNPLYYIRVNAAGNGVEAVAISAAALAGTFTGLNETPNTITANQYLRGNAGGTALEFRTISYNELSDKPEVRDPVTVAPITANPAPALTNTLYPVNTSGGAFSVTLPATPSNGDFVGFFDYAGADLETPSGLGLNPLTINPGAGHTIQGQSSVVLDQENQRLNLVFWGTRWNITAA